MTEGVDLDDLARKIAARMDPLALLDAEDVGALLKMAPTYVRDELSKAPGFPKALRLTGPNGRRSQPRWQREDITQWVASHRNGARKLGGRPRKQDL